MNGLSLKRLVLRLLMLTVVMFAFGFALVPIYDVMCKAFGINGKTGGQYEGSQVSDPTRSVRVQFMSTNASGMVWDFYSTADQLEVNPGAVNQMIFIAHNPTDRPMSAQAIPASPRPRLRRTSTRPSASASPSRCCSPANASRCRCASLSTATCRPA